MRPSTQGRSSTTCSRPRSPTSIAGPTEFAFLFGTTRPFDAATSARLYPGGRSDFLARFRNATGEALSRGFLLQADAAEIQGLAAASW